MASLKINGKEVKSLKIDGKEVKSLKIDGKEFDISNFKIVYNNPQLWQIWLYDKDSWAEAYQFDYADGLYVDTIRMIGYLNGKIYFYGWFNDKIGSRRRTTLYAYDINNNSGEVLWNVDEDGFRTFTLSKGLNTIFGTSGGEGFIKYTDIDNNKYVHIKTPEGFEENSECIESEGRTYFIGNESEFDNKGFFRLWKFDGQDFKLIYESEHSYRYQDTSVSENALFISALDGEAEDSYTKGIVVKVEDDNAQVAVEISASSSEALDLNNPFIYAVNNKIFYKNENGSYVILDTKINKWPHYFNGQNDNLLIDTKSGYIYDDLGNVVDKINTDDDLWFGDYPQLLFL